MIFAALPVGLSHGWGIVGTGIARQLAKLRPGQVSLLAQPFTVDSIGDEHAYRELAALLPQTQDDPAARHVNGVTFVDAPLLICAVDAQFTSISPNIRGTVTLAHAVFEENILRPPAIDAARRRFDLIAPASTWCRRVLADHGLSAAHTVNQGIDPNVFYPPGDPVDRPRQWLADKFVIFSGGKFEYRKAQDVVIRAIAILQQRHSDVVLMCTWYNPWNDSFATMNHSPYLSWPQVSGNYAQVMTSLMAHNGMDVSRLVLLNPCTNAQMAHVYRNSDLGLFPNRCEGGTNLVMMEYMACGKPVVATASCGHADVIRPENAFIIDTPTHRTLDGADGPIANWPEPSLDDTVEKLEQAYRDRAALHAKAKQAADDMKRFTWAHTAQALLSIIDRATA